MHCFTKFDVGGGSLRLANMFEGLFHVYILKKFISTRKINGSVADLKSQALCLRGNFKALHLHIFSFIKS